MSRLTKKLTKVAANATDFPITITANDVKMELVSQFDWFPNVPQEELDKIIDSASQNEYQSMADEINEYLVERTMNNAATKGLYAHRLAREIRYGLARALYLKKTDIIVQLENNFKLINSDIAQRPLLFTVSLYNARILKQLQDEGYIKYSDEYMQEHKEDAELELPIDRLIESKVNRIIAEAHDIAIDYVLKSQLVTKVREQIAEKRLDIITNEFWISKGIR